MSTSFSILVHFFCQQTFVASVVIMFLVLPGKLSMYHDLSLICDITEQLFGKVVESVSLNHPRTREDTLFFTCDSKLFEVVKYQSKLGCIFIDDSIKQDASFRTLTPVDPLLLAFEVFKNNDSKFRSFDDIFEKHGDLKKFLFSKEPRLELINDVREVDYDEF